MSLRKIAGISLALLMSLNAGYAQEPAKAEVQSMSNQKQIARKSVEMWSASADYDPKSVFSGDYVNHQEPLAAGGVGAIDLATWESITTNFHASFPDAKIEILMQIGEGDKVATHWRFTVTQTGTYEGQSESHKQASWTGVQIDRFAGGKIVESWVVWDKYTSWEQLGLLK
jgi:predicted ester cyclase